MRCAECTPIDDDSENAEIKPAEGRRVRQRPLPVPCKALEGRVLDVHGAKSNTAGHSNSSVLTVYALVNLG